MTCSAVEANNIDAVWNMIGEFEDSAKQEQAFKNKRDSQARDWMHHLINEVLQLKLSRNPQAKQLRAELEQRVVARDITLYTAARQIIDCL